MLAAAPKHLKSCRNMRSTAWVALLLPLSCCAAAAPKMVETQPAAPAPPLFTGVVVAIRPETSAPDPTGAYGQIMAILGRPAAVPATVSASEIVLRLPDDSVKTNMQEDPGGLTVGSKAMVTAPPDSSIQPQ